jgi:hypothetical protein
MPHISAEECPKSPVRDESTKNLYISSIYLPIICIGAVNIIGIAI